MNLNIDVLLHIIGYRLSTYPHFAHRLAAIVAYVDRDIDVLAVRIPALVQAGPQADAAIVQQKRFIDSALGTAARSNADAANAASDTGIAMGWQHFGAGVVAVLPRNQSDRVYNRLAMRVCQVELCIINLLSMSGI